MTIKGSLQVSIAVVKAFLTRNFILKSPVENWPQISVFGGNGIEMKILCSMPQKAHRCAKRRHHRQRSRAALL